MAGMMNCVLGGLKVLRVEYTPADRKPNGCDSVSRIVITAYSEGLSGKLAEDVSIQLSSWGREADIISASVYIGDIITANTMPYSYDKAAYNTDGTLLRDGKGNVITFTTMVFHIREFSVIHRPLWRRLQLRIKKWMRR